MVIKLLFTSNLLVDLPSVMSCEGLGDEYDYNIVLLCTLLVYKYQLTILLL
jgi:hypothetical protein